jgi:hypothetical protein
MGGALLPIPGQGVHIQEFNIMASKKEIKAFIADYLENTGEKLSHSEAALLMERQAEHDAEASHGSGFIYKNGTNTGVELPVEDNSYADPKPEAVAQPAAGEGVVVELEVLPEQAGAEQPPAGPTLPCLHVKQGLALRGGRGEWYKLLCQIRRQLRYRQAKLGAGPLLEIELLGQLRDRPLEAQQLGVLALQQLVEKELREHEHDEQEDDH